MAAAEVQGSAVTGLAVQVALSRVRPAEDKSGYASMWRETSTSTLDDSACFLHYATGARLPCMLGTPISESLGIA